MVDLLKLLADPYILITVSLAFGLILIAVPFRKSLTNKAGFCLMVFGFLSLYMLSIKPVSNLLAYSLESRYKPSSIKVPSGLDAVVILGGGFIPSGAFQKNPEATRETYSRLFNGVEIFKQSGAKTLILSGGTPLRFCSESDAEVMKDLAAKLGIPKNKITVEIKSRNTMDQANEVARLFPSSGNRQIGVVTSAVHMLRAEATFRKKFPNDTIVPIAVDYTSYFPNLNFGMGVFIPSAKNFSQSSCVIHEIIGIVWYNMLCGT